MVVQSKPAAIGPWGQATAGAAGAVFANSLVYPLDLYETLLFSALVILCQAYASVFQSQDQVAGPSQAD